MKKQQYDAETITTTKETVQLEQPQQPEQRAIKPKQDFFAQAIKPIHFAEFNIEEFGERELKGGEFEIQRGRINIAIHALRFRLKMLDHQETRIKSDSLLSDIKDYLKQASLQQFNPSEIRNIAHEVKQMLIDEHQEASKRAELEFSQPSYETED